MWYVTQAWREAILFGTFFVAACGQQNRKIWRPRRMTNMDVAAAAGGAAAASGINAGVYFIVPRCLCLWHRLFVVFCWQRLDLDCCVLRSRAAGVALILLENDVRRWRSAAAAVAKLSSTYPRALLRSHGKAKNAVSADAVCVKIMVRRGALSGSQATWRKRKAVAKVIIAASAVPVWFLGTSVAARLRACGARLWRRR